MSVNYFPNQSQEILKLEREFRSIVQGLSESERHKLYEIFSQLNSDLCPTKFTFEKDMVFAEQCRARIAFPRPMPMVILSHVVFGYENWLKAKYSLPGFVEIEPGDVAIDCGGYVGGFALSASRIAGEVHVFEPEERNLECTRINLENRGNVYVNQLGLYSDDTEGALNISTSGVEHSLLSTDDGITVGVKPVSLSRVDTYMENTGISKLDFIKIEAEGVELEVFDGLGEILPRKLAIDVSPEREGVSPADEFMSKLEEKGYIYKKRGHVLFARLMK